MADRRGSFDIVEPTLGSSGEPFGALLSRNDLEEDVLANLRIVLRVDSVEEVANMVLYGR